MLPWYAHQIHEKSPIFKKNTRYMNICVFCSMYDVADIYTKPAQELGNLLGQAGHALVWGGSKTGLMNVIADSVREGGGKLIGITFESIKETARIDADEMIVAKDLALRKAAMRERADAFILLPGGIGSFDEITDMLELKKHGIHGKPMVILNTNGFYDGFRTQLERMKEEGFIARPLSEYLHFAQNPEEAVEFLTTP